MNQNAHIDGQLNQMISIATNPNEFNLRSEIFRLNGKEVDGMTGWTDIQLHGKKNSKPTKKELHRQQLYRSQQRKSTPPPKQRPKT